MYAIFAAQHNHYTSKVYSLQESQAEATSITFQHETTVQSCRIPTCGERGFFLILPLQNNNVKTHTISAVIAFPSRSIAPSATMIMFKRCAWARIVCNFLQSTSGQSVGAGHSGMKQKSASDANAATTAR